MKEFITVVIVIVLITGIYIAGAYMNQYSITNWEKACIKAHGKIVYDFQYRKVCLNPKFHKLNGDLL